MLTMSSIARRQMFCTLDGFPESITSKIQKPVLLTFAIFFHNYVYEPVRASTYPPPAALKTRVRILSGREQMHGLPCLFGLHAISALSATAW